MISMLVVLWMMFQTEPPRFEDAAPKSKFDYATRNGFDGNRKYFPQPLCGGVAVLDYDNDGWMDLYFTNGAKFPELRKTGPEYYNALLRNTGGGVFEDATRQAGVAGEDLGYSLGAAAADYDNDGYTDLFVANAGPNTLYRNQGDGTFRDVSESSGLNRKPANTLSVQGAWVDYDRDGNLDLVVSNYTVWSPQTDRRCKRPDGVDYYCHPKTYPSVPHRLYRNKGSGKFEDVTETSGFGGARGKGMGIGIADMDGDGWPDVFIANDTEPNFLYLNQRNGTFREQGLSMGVAYNDDAATVSAMGVDVRDYDNDGWPDVFYNALTEQVWGLFRNISGKSFRYVSTAAGLAPLSAPYSGWSAGFLDYDNDGWRDLYSANGDVDYLRANAEQTDTVFRNEGGKRFSEVTARMGAHFQRKGYQRGAAIADFNNDGFPDLTVTALNRRPSILMNSGVGGGNWLMVRLVGTRSNRDSIGARVTVVTPAGRLMRDWVNASTGFLSSSDPRIRFGLGAERRAARIEVVWPSGEALAVTDVESNQLLTFLEPRGR